MTVLVVKVLLLAVIGPEIRSQESVSLGQSSVHSLCEISLGAGSSAGASVAVVNSSQLKKLLGGSSSDNSSSLGGRDKSNHD